MSDDFQTAACAAHSRPIVKPRRASIVHRLPNTIYDTLHPTLHETSITREVGFVLKTRRTAFRLQLHFDESMLPIECLSHLFVATVTFNAIEVAN